MELSGIKLKNVRFSDDELIRKAGNPNKKIAKFIHNMFKRLERGESAKWLSKIFELSKSEQQNPQALADFFLVWALSDRFLKNDHSVGKAISKMVNQIFNQAKQGDATSQLVLGYMYLGGIGVPENNEEAMRWIRSAAELGNVQAQKELESILLD